MTNRLLKYFLTLFAAIVVLYPVLVWFQSRTAIFPVFGLIAFTIMWLHIVGSAFRSWLEKYVNFEKFVNDSSLIVFICLLLHPFLLFINLGLAHLGDVWLYGAPQFIWLAISGWFLLITYDLGKLFHKQTFFSRHWEVIKVISTIGFFLIFFHSLGLGSHLQSGLLRLLWIFYGITAAGAVIFVYGKRLLLTK